VGWDVGGGGVGGVVVDMYVEFRGLSKYGLIWVWG